MVIIQARANRKPTGGKLKRTWTKKLSRKGRTPAFTKIGETKVLHIATKGGSSKERLHAANIVNLFDPKTKKYSKETIITTTANPANRHFARRNIITKGSLIDTAKGKARITSRPGQEGAINAVLLEEKK